MTTFNYRYPLDKTGVNPNNLVSGEEHKLSNRKIRCIAPTYGGFFAEGVIVINTSTGLPLIKGKDYGFGELFEFPTGRYGKEIFGIIIIYNESVTRVSITYQALGGDYSYSMDAVIAMIDSLELGERPVNWGDIIGRPTLYDPAAHFHDLGDIYGFEYVVHAIERLRQAILLGDVASHDEIYRYIDQVNSDSGDALDAVLDDLNDHIRDKSNPHGVTKAQVGLGYVENYPIATDQGAREGVANTGYMTPLRTAQAIQYQAIAPFNLHISNNSNPHGVTKVQVGLGNVQNYAVATAAEAVNASINNKYMTPQSTVAAINQHAIAPLNGHITNTNNPHAVTKTQVGLGNVQNFSVADKTTAEAGTSDSHYMTPRATREAVTGAVNAGLYDTRFVPYSQQRNGSVYVNTSAGTISMYLNGAQRQVWPPLWQ